MSEKYSSTYTGAEVDEAVGRVLNGDISTLDSRLTIAEQSISSLATRETDMESSVTSLASAVNNLTEKTKEVFCTQSEYDALVDAGTIDSSTKYYIFEE